MLTTIATGGSTTGTFDFSDIAIPGAAVGTVAIASAAASMASGASLGSLRLALHDALPPPLTGSGVT